MRLTMRLTRRGAVATILGAMGAAGAAALVATAAAAGPAEAPVPLPRAERQAVADRVFATPRMPSGISGWIAVDLDSGAVLDASNADHAFAPASVAKLPTAFYALDRLGPDHRFVTRLLATGPVMQGTLRGDLVLAGGGDPELDTDSLEPLVNGLRARGVTRVTGRLLVDGSAGVQKPTIDPTQPIDAAYNPSLSGLALNFNRVRLKWNSAGAAAGKAPSVRVSAHALRHDPEVQGVRVAPAAAPDAPLFTHALEADAEVWHVRAANLRGKGARWLPVRRPELHAGEVLATLARQQGVALGPVAIGAAPAGAEALARVESRPLEPMLASMLRYSTNLTAEMIGQAATRAGGMQPGSLAASAAAMGDWAARAAGFPAGDPGFRLANHSGLSETSRLSPRRMVELLVAMARRQPAAGARRTRLPGGAIDLVRDYSVAAKGVDIDFARLDIAAKTGTMDYVRGLAGYIATPSGRRLAFAVFSNDLAKRRPDTRNIDRPWMARARAFERALIRNWVLATGS